MLACEKRSGLPGTGDRDLRGEIAEIRLREAPDSIEVEGVFIPSRQIKIKSAFSGRVENLSVLKGQTISAGSTLFQIADEDLPLELDHLRAELRAAETQLEQNRRLAVTEVPEEEPVEEEIEEVMIEEPVFEFLPARESAFAQLASEIQFTPVDAGGVWPGINPMVIERATDAQDAGGIWPRYGAREMVTGERPFGFPEPPLLAASLPNPIYAESALALSTIATPVRPPVEIPTAREPPAVMEYEETETRPSLDQARVDRIRAEVAITENELERRSLTSPMDGKINDVTASEGSPVKPGDFLMEIFQVDPIEFSVKVSKDQAEFLEVGMEIHGRLSDPPDLPFEGEISFIGAELNDDNKTVEVRARVNNPDDVFKVGMEGDGKIIVKK
jgi:multidrug efflux pump subunit AcrA (membrane-fusion protein)